MVTELALFIPAAQAARLYPSIAAATEGRAELVRDRTLPCVPLSALRCLDMRMHGSLERVRLPLAWPFIRTDGFNFDHADPGPHTLTGPDWLVLGKNSDDLAQLLSQALEARAARGESTVVRVAPYATLSGPLPQKPQASDTPFTFRKSPKNFNQPAWVQHMERLKELSEERWGEVGISNTADLVHVFDQALARLAPPAPRLILDLGCGLGQITRTLALRYPEARVVGLDASAEAIAVAAHAFRLPNLRFSAVDFSKPLNFPKACVDIIVSTNALPYALDQLASARELFGLLSPEGLLLNHCRAEESQHFWDFPKSLGLPSNSQIFLCDWLTAARESGRGTEVASVPVGMGALYFVPAQAKVFADPLNAYADSRRDEVTCAYEPWLSHVLLAHSARAHHADETALPLAQNHLERLGRVLNSVVAAPAEVKEAAIVAWICTSRMLGLAKESLEFFEALIPGSAPVLRPVLGATLEDEHGPGGPG